SRLVDVMLVIICVLMLMPLVFLISNGFKTPQELLAYPATIIPASPTLDNFIAVLSATPLLTWMFNSLAFALISTVSIVVTSAIAGYVFAKFSYASLGIIFALILATAMVPFEVYMIPLYFQV